VTKTSTEKEIKKAFRKLARKHHPDVNPGDNAAESKIKDLNEAYEVLGDPEKRKKYDELGANWRQYEQAGGPGAGAGYRTVTPDEMADMFGGTSSFSDFFSTFFGGGPPSEAGERRGTRKRQRPGRDVEHEIELTLEEAYLGATRRLSLKYDGHARTVEVRIPAGVGDGSRVRVSGEGEHGVGGAVSGDLYLRVRIAPHPLFERKGRDLHVKVAVPVTTAVLGGEADVPTPAGKPARLRIPPLTQNGQVFRLKGYGMPAVGKPDGRPEDKGDVYGRIDVQVPAALSPDEREHWEALAKLTGGAASSNSAA
jgi:DnaJ-class molecular chaperone